MENMVLQNSLYLYLSKTKRPEYGCIQDASLRFFIYSNISLLFGILIGILTAQKVEKRREIKGFNQEDAWSG